MPSHLEARIARIEAAMDRQFPVSHHRHVVNVPVDTDVDAYLRALPCVCGVVGCELKTHGLVVPQTLSREAWQQRAQQFYARWDGHA